MPKACLCFERMLLIYQRKSFMPQSDPYYSAPPSKPTSRSWLKFFLMALAIVLVAVVAYRVYQSLTQAARAKAVPITELQIKLSEVMTVGDSVFEQALPLSGSLSPYVQTIVRPRASGEVSKMLVREGDAVREGQVLAELVSTTYRAQYQQALSSLQSAQSSYDVTQTDYKNNQQLQQEGFISKMALDKLDANKVAAQTQLNNAKQALLIAEHALSETIIKAPVSGYIASRSSLKGDTVSNDTAMFSIVNIDSFELAAPISAEQVGSVHVGQTVELTSAGMAQGFNGTVERINPAAQNGSRSYLIYIRVDNSTGQLKAGMFAQGKIILASMANSLTVPAAALHTDGDKTFVYKIIDGKLVKQFVETGARASDAIDAAVQINSGLTAGERVVRLDLGTLKEGISINVLDDNAAAKAVEPSTDKK